MPGLIARTMTIIKAKYSKLLDKTENPNEMLDYSYEQQLQQLQNVKRGIADVATAKKRLEMQYTTMQQQADKLDGQAKAALAGEPRGPRARGAHPEGGDPGPARGDHGVRASSSRRSSRSSSRARRRSSAKIEQFRTQKEVIKAQYSAAEAQVRIGEAATGISNQMSDVGLAVQRAKDKTESMQARADAIDELTAAGALEDFTSPGDDIDRQLKEIQQSGQVDDELAKLKAEIGAPAGAGRGRRCGARAGTRARRGARRRGRRGRHACAAQARTEEDDLARAQIGASNSASQRVRSCSTGSSCSSFAFSSSSVALSRSWPSPVGMNGQNAPRLKP